MTVKQARREADKLLAELRRRLANKAVVDRAQPDWPKDDLLERVANVLDTLR